MYSVDLTWMPHEPKEYLQLWHDAPASGHGWAAWRYYLDNQYVDELQSYPSFLTYQLLFKHFKKATGENHCLIVGVVLWFSERNDAIMFKLTHV